MIICWPIMKDIPKKLLGNETVVVSTVAKTQKPWCQLSPFILGPCKLYGGLVSKNMENGWQYSKLYAEHASTSGEGIYHPKQSYWRWARAGWMNPKAVRYPMGKGRKPLCSLWEGKQLSYVDARKQIYVPLYAEAVQKTSAFRSLQSLVRLYDTVILKDYDAYDHQSMGMSLTEVLNNPDKKMGHAFVLAMLLTNDDALEQCAMR